MNKPSKVSIRPRGHARSCIDVIESQNCFKIASFIGLENDRHVKSLGYSVIGSDEALPRLATINPYTLIVTVQIKEVERRIYLVQQAKQLCFQLLTIIASTADIFLYFPGSIWVL
jgi:hypothetical protein